MTYDTVKYLGAGSRFLVALMGILLLASSVTAKSLPASWVSLWPNTDFSKTTVDLETIQSGGPPRDGIPAIDNPRFISVEEASDWIVDREPVIVLDLGGDVRAYPLQIMVWHEIVNDTVAGVPVAVTFCPLCYSAIAFDRRISGKVYDFGTSGLLRHSDLVMYDRQTESLWQQLTGEAIVGEWAGLTLKMIPAALIGFDRFRSQHPNGRVLSRETGHDRDYGRNPYAGYDDISTTPISYRGELPEKLKPMEHLVTVQINGEAVGYPYRVLKRGPVVNDTVDEVPIVVFYEATTRTALRQAKISRGGAIGSSAVFDRRVNGLTLSFAHEKGHFVDLQTRSVWNIFGVAQSGPLKGAKLTRLVSGDFFAFAWLAFRPDTRVYRAESQ